MLRDTVGHAHVPLGGFLAEGRALGCCGGSAEAEARIKNRRGACKISGLDINPLRVKRNASNYLFATF